MPSISQALSDFFRQTAIFVRKGDENALRKTLLEDNPAAMI
jgi:hypothetical protein